MLSRPIEELVYVSSEDGLLLDGLALHPVAPPKPLSFVVVHGNAARFYDYTYVGLCRALAAAGYPCVTVNTRGHDIAAFIWRGDEGQPRAWPGPQDMPLAGGAGWEQLEDAPRDLAAWVAFAAQLAPGVVLVGHSSGAQRVALYQAERQDARVRGLGLASPDLRGFLMPGELETAQRMVVEGNGLDVVPAQPFVPGYRQSAATIVSRAAVVDHLQAACATITCPILAFVGAAEPAHAAVLDTVRTQFPSTIALTTRVMPDADHFYTAQVAEVAAVLADWAATLSIP
jgi:alpha-beta hydrolase superfamily lysophospholipase